MQSHSEKLSESLQRLREEIEVAYQTARAGLGELPRDTRNWEAINMFYVQLQSALAILRVIADRLAAAQV